MDDIRKIKIMIGIFIGIEIIAIIKLYLVLSQ